jgi:protein involved in polysaccharide export with SLBB domain
LQHNPQFELDDYIALCGGYLDAADKGNIAVLAANNAATKVKTGGWLFGKSGSVAVSPGSVIDVPFAGEATRLETVEVKGAVVKPAVLQYIKGARLGYYLNLTGGYAKDADLDKLAVLLPDGDMLIKRENTAFNPILPPGSIVIVTVKATGGAK